MNTATAPAVYPVHVEATLDPGLSRGLWLVKWILVLPHLVVLAFLWAAFAVTSLFAFLSILTTARYPRALFDFNVGVLRWSWRVAFYAYGALGTDRYPPFTLADVPDYPAHLSVDRPGQLSRGLVLVKWWLLAIPHYLVVALLVGGAGYGVRGTADNPVLGTSLLGILVLVAGVVLLVTGHYPGRLFDLVLGLNRWVLRVVGYVALMTDRYPPFRLDQGGHEHGVIVDSSPPALQASAAPPSSAGWTPGRVTSLVIGSLLVLVSLGLGGTGAALAWADQTERGPDGFLTGPSETLTSAGFAITSGNLELHADGPAALMPERVLGDLSLTAESRDGEPLFLGVAPTAEAERYLAGVGHDTLVQLRDGEPVSRTTVGGAPATTPTEQDFWLVEDVAVDARVILPWNDGDWTVVVMAADGSAGVAAEVAAGAELPDPATIIAALLVAGGLTLLVGAVLMAVPVRAASGEGFPS